MNADFDTSTKPFTVAGLPRKGGKGHHHGHDRGDDHHGHDRGDDDRGGSGHRGGDDDNSGPGNGDDK